MLPMLPGCEPAATDTPSVAGASAGTKEVTKPGSYWRPEVKSIRVYPSTRFIRESGRAILEARFELYDEMGDPLKAAGTFQVELYSIDESLGNAPQRLLYTWSADTLTLDQQREHYDPITRGYLFRLGVDNLKAARQATLLKVAFTPAGRPRLEAEAVIQTDW
ncbi:MAG: hypothetical protein R3C45_19980 [Phycisphaerales bacterium]